jgi:hypothetical protein
MKTRGSWGRLTREPSDKAQRAGAVIGSARPSVAERPVVQAAEMVTQYFDGSGGPI